MSVKDLLKKSIPKKFHSKIPSSFDVIGNKDKAVAIVEIPQELKRYRVRIATAIMKQHKNVSTVLEKSSPRKGVYRIRDFKVIAGSKDTEVVHNESGCRFFLDPCQVYFSSREGTERLRITSLIKNSETVMVFFAGVGPFPVIISKKSGAEKAVGIEINPAAVQYFRRNVALNKCRNVEVVEGDVKKASSRYSQLCDRVIMPLPERSLEYLPQALECVKPGGVVHVYFFSAEEDIAKVKTQLRSMARKAGKKISFLGTARVLPYGPKIWKMRIDVRVMQAVTPL